MAIRTIPPLLADGGDMTIMRHVASHAYGTLTVTYPDGVDAPEDNDLNQAYTYQLRDEDTPPFGRAFIRADLDIDAENNTSTVEEVLDDVTGRTAGEALFQRDITRAGLGRLELGVDFNVGDLVPVRLWGRILENQLITAADDLSSPGDPFGCRVHVGGQLIREPSALAKGNRDVARQIAQERKERLAQVKAVDKKAEDAKSTADTAQGTADTAKGTAEDAKSTADDALAAATDADGVLRGLLEEGEGHLAAMGIALDSAGIALDDARGLLDDATALHATIQPMIDEGRGHVQDALAHADRAEDAKRATDTALTEMDAFLAQAEALNLQIVESLGTARAHTARASSFAGVATGQAAQAISSAQESLRLVEIARSYTQQVEAHLDTARGYVQQGEGQVAAVTAALNSADILLGEARGILTAATELHATIQPMIDEGRGHAADALAQADRADAAHAAVVAQVGVVDKLVEDADAILDAVEVEAAKIPPLLTQAQGHVTSAKGHADRADLAVAAAQGKVDLADAAMEGAQAALTGATNLLADIDGEGTDFPTAITQVVTAHNEVLGKHQETITLHGEVLDKHGEAIQAATAAARDAVDAAAAVTEAVMVLAEVQGMHGEVLVKHGQAIKAAGSAAAMASMTAMQASETARSAALAAQSALDAVNAVAEVQALHGEVLEKHEEVLAKHGEAIDKAGEAAASALAAANAVTDAVATMQAANKARDDAIGAAADAAGDAAASAASLADAVLEVIAAQEILEANQEIQTQVNINLGKAVKAAGTAAAMASMTAVQANETARSAALAAQSALDAVNTVAQVQALHGEVLDKHEEVLTKHGEAIDKAGEAAGSALEALGHMEDAFDHMKASVDANEDATKAAEASALSAQEAAEKALSAQMKGWEKFIHPGPYGLTLNDERVQVTLMSDGLSALVNARPGWAGEIWARAYYSNNTVKPLHSKVPAAENIYFGGGSTPITHVEVEYRDSQRVGMKSMDGLSTGWDLAENNKWYQHKAGRPWVVTVPTATELSAVFSVGWDAAGYSGSYSIQARVNGTPVKTIRNEGFGPQFPWQGSGYRTQLLSLTGGETLKLAAGDTVSFWVIRERSGVTFAPQERKIRNFSLSVTWSEPAE